MKKRWISIISIIKFILIVLCFVGGIIIGLYKIPNQNLTLKISTNEERKVIHYSASEIEQRYANEQEIFIPWEEGEDVYLKEIKVYRIFKSIVIAKINQATVYQYGFVDEKGITFSKEGV